MVSSWLYVPSWLYLSYADVEGTTWATIAYITALTIHTHACAMHEPQLYDQPSHRVHSSSRTCHLWRRASMSAPRSSSRSSISDEPATCSAVGKAQRNIGRLSAEPHLIRRTARHRVCR